MQNGTRRGLVALALLATALAFVYLSGHLDSLTGSASDADFRYVADLDFWQRTPRERLVTATAAFDLQHDLREVPLAVGDWQGESVPQTNIGVFIVLEPEQYEERLYRNSRGHYLWLTMIGGRSSRTFHSPESCYESYGWQTQLSSHAIALEDGSTVHGMVVEARQGEDEQVSFYFYLFPDSSRDQGDGIVIFRVTSPRYGTMEDTMVLQEEFIRHFFSGSEPL